MTEKRARHHHYVPQFYLRNFGTEDKVHVFNTDTNKLFTSSPRNIGGERDLYRLEGAEPQLAEEMFGKIETALTPIFLKMISTEVLPAIDSDEFVSLLTFISTLVLRHPRVFDAYEGFTREWMTKTVEIQAANVSTGGLKLEDGTVLSADDLRESVDALREGKIRIHVPRDHSLAAMMSTVRSLTETLLQRNWTLAIADGASFITSTHPVLLCWDQLSLHDQRSPGFGLEGTTVYFPISPRLMMIGKFNPVRERCVMDSAMIAALNGLHGVYSPRLLISQEDTSPIQIEPAGTILFKDLEATFKIHFSNKE